MADRKPFKSDGCTAVPDFIFYDCCVAHDLAYWKGGTLAQKREADREFYECMKGKIFIRYYRNTRMNRIRKAAYSALAWVYWIGVRAVPWPWMPMPNSRWGYGYKWPRYK